MIIAPVDDWQSLGLDPWHIVAGSHARVRPCPPLDTHGLSAPQIRARIADALRHYEITRPNGTKRVQLVDVTGRIIHAPLGYLGLHLSKDADHWTFAAWTPMTIETPIEVWDREEPGKGIRRYYLSAYQSGSANGRPHIHCVSIGAKNGAFVTSFRKPGSAGIDGKRKGDPIYRCY